MSVSCKFPHEPILGNLAQKFVRLSTLCSSLGLKILWPWSTTRRRRVLAECLTAVISKSRWWCSQQRCSMPLIFTWTYWSHLITICFGPAFDLVFSRTTGQFCLAFLLCWRLELRSIDLAEAMGPVSQSARSHWLSQKKKKKTHVFFFFWGGAQVGTFFFTNLFGVMVALMAFSRLGHLWCDRPVRWKRDSGRGVTRTSWLGDCWGLRPGRCPLRTKAWPPLRAWECDAHVPRYVPCKKLIKQ